MESVQDRIAVDCQTARVECSDLSEYLEALGGLVESRITQLEPGPLTVKMGLLRLGDIVLSTASYDRALLDSFSVPAGLHFVFLAPELSRPCLFCGKSFGADSFGIFQGGSSYMGLSGARHRFVEISLPLSYLPPSVAEHPRWQGMRAPEKAVFSVSQMGAGPLRADLFTLFAMQRELATAGKRDPGFGVIKEWLVTALVGLLQKVLAIPAVDPPASQGLRFDLFHTALELIDASLEEPLSTSLLAKRLGVSPRLLQYTFQDYARITPGRYILHRRLQAIRGEIKSPKSPDMSLLEYALAHGIEHPGRFSQDYKRLFGELPSATKKQQRS